MNKRLVLWGENEKDEKKLIALELFEKENEVKIYTFAQEIATQEFYNEMMDKWRLDNEVTFPEPYETMSRPLTVSEEVLPETLKVERTDLISRAQAEWHFIVLSTKLYDVYDSELSELEERVGNADKFKDQLWNEMKNYWAKVQNQLNEKNLFNDHGYELKKRTNKVFDSLKELRKKQEAKYEEKSKEAKAEFVTALEAIEEKIEKKLGLKPLFNELKGLQNKLKKEDLTRNDRNTIWNRIDKAFKDIKAIKYGDEPGKPVSGVDRVSRRYDGLMNAIGKMERSIKRDKNDLSFQDNRINKTDGQLEMQLRQAKVKIIEERINSKNEKLEDMMKTKIMLEDKMEKEKQKETEKAEQAKREEAKKAAKEKIAAEIEDKKEETEGISKELSTAAALITGKAATDTAAKDDKNLADKADDKADDIADATEEKLAEAKEKAVDLKDKAVDKAEDITDAAKAKVDELTDDSSDGDKDLSDKVADKADDIADATEEKLAEAKEKAVDLKDKAVDKAEDIADAAKAKVAELTDDSSDGESDLSDKASNLADEAKEKLAEVKESTADIADKAADKAEDLADAAKEKIEEITDTDVNAEKEAKVSSAIADAKAEVSKSVDTDGVVKQGFVSGDADANDTDASDKIAEAAAGAQSKIADLADNAEDGAEEVLEKIEDIADKAQEKIKNLIDELKGEEE